MRPARKRRLSAGARWAIAIGILALAAAAYFAYMAIAMFIAFQPPGVVPYERWPGGLVAEHEAWAHDGIRPHRMEVYATEAMFNDAAICRMSDDPEVWAYLRARYAAPGDDPTYARRRWGGVAEDLPGWAPNLDDPAVEVLASSNQEGEGHQVRLARDPARGKIFVDYYCNF